MLIVLLSMFYICASQVFAQNMKPLHKDPYEAVKEMVNPNKCLTVRDLLTRFHVYARKEAAKVLLGHASTSITEIYLLEEVQEAMKVAKAFSS